MIKYCTEHSYNSTVNLSTRMIWCYACDMDSVTISKFYQDDNEDCHTQEDFIQYTEFVNKVIFAIRESVGEVQEADTEGLGHQPQGRLSFEEEGPSQLQVASNTNDNQAEGELKPVSEVSSQENKVSSPTNPENTGKMEEE